jgi:iron(III) transport system substrate-binding protein
MSASVPTTRARVLAALGAAAAALPAAPSTAALAPDVLAAAKREGTVVWYTSLEGPSLAAVSARFKTLYPEIAFTPLRLSQVEIPPRVLTEQRGAHYGVDLVAADPTLLTGLVQAGALEPYRPAELRGINGGIEPRGYWSSLYNVTVVIAWNPLRLKERGLQPPATLDDLGRPEWKGRIGLNAAAPNFYLALVQTNRRAEEIVRRIAANAPLLTSTHTGTVAQLEAGEFDVTPTAYGYLAQREKDGGRPVDYVNTRPLVLYPESLALVKNAPHPNAARVLYEWLVSRDGQQTIVDASARNSLRPDVRNDVRVFDSRRPYEILRPVAADRYAALTKEFKTLLGNPAA